MLRKIIGIICSASVLLTLVSGCKNDDAELSAIDEATATAVISDSSLSRQTMKESRLLSAVLMMPM